MNQPKPPEISVETHKTVRISILSGIFIGSHHFADGAKVNLPTATADRLLKHKHVVQLGFDESIAGVPPPAKIGKPAPPAEVKQGRQARST